MSGNTYGTLFKISTFGESHGMGIGVVIDGCPAGLPLSEADIQPALDRRRPGQSKIVTQRRESDTLQILSGVFEGKTTGTPIALFIVNANQRSKDYDHIKNAYRPSHADYTYDKKYGFRDYRGGGRSSARETAARVAAGEVARKLLQLRKVKITAFVSQVGNLKLETAYDKLGFHNIEQNPVRCPDLEMASQMEKLILEVRKAGDTIGGVVSCLVQGVPPGWGQPVFDKLHAELGKAMLSINAAKGFEYGSGFSGVSMRGSQHNDIFHVDEKAKVITKTNHSGGIQGGISNGMDIYFKVAFKPVATIMQIQNSIDKTGKPTQITGKGRHDPCVVPRAVPIVEAMAALTLTDFMLRAANDRLA